MAFLPSGDIATGCVDINECKESPCDANAQCANSIGSYTCTCCNGYSGDGDTCEDINECNAAMSGRKRNPVTSMPIVSIKTVLSTVNIILDTLEMVLNMLISTNVSKVVTTVILMLLVPIPSVVGLALVIPDTMVTVLVVLILTNVSPTHVALMAIAVTMMDHTPALVRTVSTVMVKYSQTSTSVLQLMPVMPMQPVPMAVVSTAAHVTVASPVTVWPVLTMMNVHSEQTTAM